MVTLMAERGAPVHLILGGGDVVFLLILLAVNVPVAVRGAFRELGFLLALMLGFIVSGHCRLWLREDSGALGCVLAMVAVVVTILLDVEARRAGQAWARAAQVGFGLLSATVGIVLVLDGGPTSHLPAVAHLPSYFVLGCVAWGLWVNRRQKAWADT